MSAVASEVLAKATTAVVEEELQQKYEVSVEECFDLDPGELPYQFWFRRVGESTWRPIEEMDIRVKGGVSLAVLYLVRYEEGPEPPNFTTHPVQWVHKVSSAEGYQPIDTPGSFQVSRNDNRTCTLTITNTTTAKEKYEFFLCVTWKDWLAGAHPTVTTLPDT